MKRSKTLVLLAAMLMLCGCVDNLAVQSAVTDVPKQTETALTESGAVPTPSLAASGPATAQPTATADTQTQQTVDDTQQALEQLSDLLGELDSMLADDFD